MSLRISEELMSCDRSGQRAVRRADGRWTVSGYGGRAFDRDQAITALTLGEVLAISPPPGDPIWLFVPGWRAELGTAPTVPTGMTRADRPRRTDRLA
ncbi:hypothetical protein [Spongiactinospora sp. TRM90649]|uniref:hypothetical protein n=1 Tax=Spongiactinospora sp. TRM90649 TaxID=3031114 RepID=UPI0023F7EBFC|nr:hypothetical protein [Spongiactinospora sp. TRM90649]MDF5751952.1 hypothetical protein [Spongiactinospora sp. TRM90649]